MRLIDFVRTPDGLSALAFVLLGALMMDNPTQIDRSPIYDFLEPFSVSGVGYASVTIGLIQGLLVNVYRYKWCKRGVAILAFAYWCNFMVGTMCHSVYWLPSTALYSVMMSANVGVVWRA